MRTKGRGSLIVLALLAVASCGVPQFVFLAPPELGSVSSLPPTVSFAHDELNDIDSFLGYELYYKFYDPAAGDVTAAFSADRSAIEAATPGSVVSALGSRGYLRVYAGASAAPPALTVTLAERDEAFSVSVIFPASPASTDDAVATWNAFDERTVVLLRDQEALGNPLVPAGFTPSEITSADGDTPDPLPATLEMGLAVATYGIDYITGTFAELYSTAIVADKLLVVSYQ